MSTFFFSCALLGGAVLVLQLVLGLIGAGHHHSDAGHAHVGDSHLPDALDLFSIRALSAALTFFGFAGLGTMGLGLPWLFALPVALIAALAAAYGVAFLMRSMLRLEKDNTASIAETVGTTGTVYLGIPAARGGVGKVHLVLRNRTLECTAVTPEGALATGTPVLVIDIVNDDTVVVVPHPPSAEEPTHDAP